MTGQTDITVRPFEEADAPSVAELFRSTWLGELPKEEGTLAATLVLASYLADHAWGLVAQRNGRTLGTVLAGLRDSNDSARWAVLAEGALARARALDQALPGKLGTDAVVEKEEARIARELKASDLPEADATVQLLLLSPEARGHHVGFRLLDAARTWMRSQGARGYFLMTDDECDVGFYDHLGLRRMRTAPVQTSDGMLNVYAYGELL